MKYFILFTFLVIVVISYHFISDRETTQPLIERSQTQPAYAENPSATTVDQEHEQIDSTLKTKEHKKPSIEINQSRTEVDEINKSGQPKYSIEDLNRLLDSRECQKCNLQGADLSNLDLSMVNLTEANLQGANLSGTLLKDATLKGANLQRADLTDASLFQATLSKADLSQAKFRGIDFTYGSATGATFTNADFTDTRLIDTHMDGADLSGANLTNVDASGATMKDTIWTGAKLDGTILSNNINISWEKLSKEQLCSAYITSEDFTPQCP